jgi:hypothetical protein
VKKEYNPWLFLWFTVSAAIWAVLLYAFGRCSGRIP